MKLKLPAMATFTGGENRLSPAEKENLGCSNIDSKICLYIWDCLLQVLAMEPLLLVLLPVHASVLDLLQMPNFISSECLLIVRYGAFTDSNSSYCRTQLGTGKVSQTVKRSWKGRRGCVETLTNCEYNVVATNTNSPHSPFWKFNFVYFCY